MHNRLDHWGKYFGHWDSFIVFRILGQFHSFLGYDHDKFSGHWEKFSGLWNKFSAPLDKITGVGTSEKKFTRSSPGCVPSQVLPLLV